MNTAQYKKIIRVRHEMRLETPFTARDLGDFQHQVAQQFEEIKGRSVKFDDDFTVESDDEGITAWFETKEPKE